MKSKFSVDKKEGCVLVPINPKIYPLDVILSAAYVMTENNYILIDGEPSKEITVEIRPKDKKSSLDTVGREFHNELVNYATYAVQSIRNEKLREAILSRVLFTNEEYDNEQDECTDAQSQEPAQDGPEEVLEELDEEPLEDPLGIAIPWEEKYGKDKNKKK